MRLYSPALLISIFLLLTAAYVTAQTGKHTIANVGKPTPPLSREKYHDIWKAAMQIKSALSVGAAYGEFGQRVQSFQTEIEMLPKPKTDNEATVLREFNVVAGLY